MGAKGGVIMITKQELEHLVERNRHFYQNGEDAQYIPALSQVDPKQLGVTIYDVQSNCIISAGEYDTSFAIESISKVPVLLLAIKQRGLKEVFSHIDCEPTGFPFNSILNMEINQRKMPMNPFVNVGAIFIGSLLQEKDSRSRFTAMLDFMKLIMNDNTIALNEEIYQSESKTGDINRSLAYYLKGEGILEEDIDIPDLLDSYFKQCSVNVNTIQLASLAAVLANNGIAPWNKKEIISREAAIITKSLMTTAGLYDESGDFSSHIGLPAKSGVGGGLMAVAPQKYGIAIFGPSLDIQGNSVAGMKLLKDIVDELEVNIFA